MNRYTIKTFILLIALAISCAQLPESEFYSANGIISIRASSIAAAEGWVTYSTSLLESKISVSTSVSSPNNLRFDFYVQNPGYYSFWILGTNLTKSPDEALMVRILDGDQYLVNSLNINLPQSLHPLWFEAGINQDNNQIQFLKEGYYSVHFESGGKPGFILSGIHLSMDSETEPAGVGFPETKNHLSDPVLEKREHHVEIPPAWAFGVIFSAAEINMFPDVLNNLQPDAAINNSNSGEEFPLSGKIGFYIDLEEERDRLDQIELFDFLVLKSPRGIKELQNIYSQRPESDASQTRKFHLSEAVELGNPKMKSYPAMWLGSNLKGFEQLRDQVDMVSNPYRITYEVPFMAAMPVFAKKDLVEQISEELFIRRLQFLALNTIMVLPLPSAETFNYSDEVLRQIIKFKLLRQQLFPYIYSLTLRARTARIKPLTGDSSYPTQFHLGDAFLSAPITEEGSDQRLVFFPEGTWFNYWNDAEYPGGQSWIVEAPLSETPLFVKAGSIIPYRNQKAPVSETDNSRLNMDIYTGAPGTFRLYEDDGITRTYKNGEFSTTAFRYFEHEDYSTFTIGTVVRGFEGRRTETEYILRFKFMHEPLFISVNGEEIPRGNEFGMWYFNEKDRSVIIKWTQPDNRRTEFNIQVKPSNLTVH